MIKNLAIGGGSNRTLLLLALLLGLIAAILIGVYLSSLEGKDEATGPTATRVVVVVSPEASVPALTTITAEMVTTKAVPVDLVLTGGFTEVDDVVGQKTQVALVPGEQVIQTKILSPDTATDQFGESAPLSTKIPEGMRGFAVQVSAVASANGLVRSGDRVDVIFSGLLEGMSGEEGSDFTAASACYMAQNLLVLAWDSSTIQATGAGAAGIAATEANADASRATLAVTPDQAWQMAAVQQGLTQDGSYVLAQLWVSLRPFGDESMRGDLPTCSVAASANPVPGS